MIKFKYAGFWRRVLAHFIDQIILGFISSIIIIPIMVFLGFGIFSRFNNSNGFQIENASFRPEELSYYEISLLISLVVVITIVSIIISWLYYALMESSRKQATVGKLILNIRVTTLSGERISFGRATGRYFAKILSSLILGLGYLVMLFSERKQTLHDMLSGCIIIDSNQFELQKILNQNESQEVSV